MPCRGQRPRCCTRRALEPSRHLDVITGHVQLHPLAAAAHIPESHSLLGPFLYDPVRRMMPAPLRVFIDFIKAGAG